MDESPATGSLELLLQPHVEARCPYWGVYPFQSRELPFPAGLSLGEGFGSETKPAPNMSFYLDSELVKSIRSREGIDITDSLGYQGCSGVRTLTEKDTGGVLVTIKNVVPIVLDKAGLHIDGRGEDGKGKYHNAIGGYTGLAAEYFINTVLVLPPSLIDSVAIVDRAGSRSFCLGSPFTQKIHTKIVQSEQPSLELDFSRVKETGEPTVYAYSLRTGSVFGQHPPETQQGDQIVYRVAGDVLEINPKIIHFGIMEKQAGGTRRLNPLNGYCLSDGSQGYCFKGFTSFRYMDAAETYADPKSGYSPGVTFDIDLSDSTTNDRPPQKGTSKRLRILR